MADYEMTNVATETGGTSLPSPLTLPSIIQQLVRKHEDGYFDVHYWLGHSSGFTYHDQGKDSSFTHTSLMTLISREWWELGPDVSIKYRKGSIAQQRSTYSIDDLLRSTARSRKGKHLVQLGKDLVHMIRNHIKHQDYNMIKDRELARHKWSKNVYQFLEKFKHRIRLLPRTEDYVLSPLAFEVGGKFPMRTTRMLNGIRRMEWEVFKDDAWFDLEDKALRPLIAGLLMLSGIVNAGAVISDPQVIQFMLMLYKFKSVPMITEPDRLLELLYHCLSVLIRPNYFDLSKEEEAKLLAYLYIVTITNAILKERGVNNLTHTIVHTCQTPGNYQPSSTVVEDWCKMAYRPKSPSPGDTITFWRPATGRVTGFAPMVGGSRKYNMMIKLPKGNPRSIDWTPQLQYSTNIAIQKEVNLEEYTAIAASYSGQIMYIDSEDETLYPAKIKIVGMNPNPVGVNIGKPSAFDVIATLLLGSTPLIKSDTGMFVKTFRMGGPRGMDTFRFSSRRHKDGSITSELKKKEATESEHETIIEKAQKLEATRAEVEAAKADSVEEQPKPEANSDDEAAGS